MKYRDDYAKAEVPMLPVIASPVETTRQILLYTWLTVITSLLLIPAASWIYLVAAILTGVVFIAVATKLHRDVARGEEVKPLRLFILSNNYLALLFIGLSVDAVVNLPTLAEILGWNIAFF